MLRSGKDRKKGEWTFVLKKFMLEEPSKPGGLSDVPAVPGQACGSPEAAVMGWGWRSSWDKVTQSHEPQ